MALPLGTAGLAENDAIDRSPDDEYLTGVNEAGSSIRMHLDAVDGIAHDVTEGVKALPRRGAEIGGLLLGRVTAGADVRDVCVERYRRIECEHRFGPQFALDEAELDNVQGVADDEELAVLGFYRSNTRAEFGIEESDVQILDRYFADPGDLALLLQPERREIQARFFVRNEAREWQAAGEAFLFRGRVLGLLSEPEAEVNAEANSPAAAEPPSERPRRLVADFLPPGEALRPPPAAAAPEPPTLTPPGKRDDDTQPRGRRWWPLAGALALVGGAIFFLVQMQRPDKPDAAASAAPLESAAIVRPLGLYADPSGDTWRITWNTTASALQGARSVALFVREGEDQNRIDLAPRDLQSGSYQYQPRADAGPTKDVTFRLEVTDARNQLAAESFRVVRSAPAAAPAPRQAAPAAAHPKPIRKVPPVVPASIRPRIHGSVPVDVRVEIDSRGRVASAAPSARPHGGLNTFLTARAVAAAKQWRFEPGPATEMIHFVFER